MLPHNYMAWELLAKNHQGKILSGLLRPLQTSTLGYLRDPRRVGPPLSAVQNTLSLTTREAVNSGQKVYIQDLITSGQLEERLGDALDPARTHVYLCGNPKMIGVPNVDKTTGFSIFPQPLGLIEILSKRGFQMDQPSVKLKGNIHVEEYW